MNILILGENNLINLSAFNNTIFSTFSFISSIYARQIAAVTPKQHSVKMFSADEKIDFSEKFDAIHIHFKTSTANNAYIIADRFKEKGDNVILSGGHPSAMPKEAKEHADAVLIGSAEALWPYVIKDLEENQLKPFYKSSNYPSKKKFSVDNSFLSQDLKLVGVIEVSRGCPYKCDFCQDSNILQGSVFRTRPIEEVIKEIKNIPQKFLFFCDVSMTIDPDYTKSLFKAMKPLKKKFVCEGNADVLARDEELLKLSNDAGCIEWTVGFESFNQQTLASVNKKTNKTNDFAQVIEKVHKFNMGILGNFMFGFDNDNPEVFDYTKENINNLGLDSARFAILTPYPGTPLFDRLEKQGRILTYDWSKYNRQTVVFKPKKMTVDELYSGFFEISKNFNKLSNVLRRDLKSLELGFYPFLDSVVRNLESYMNRPRKAGL